MSGLLRFAIPIAIIALLAGCAHIISLPLPGVFDAAPLPSRSAALKRMQHATPCCHSWSSLPFHQRLPAAPREFSFDKFSPVANLDGAPTHFLTFVLPKYQHPYRIAFQTRPSARHLGNSFLLAPTITVLGADHQPLSSTNVTLCIYVGWRPSLSGAFGAVAIDDRHARYLVVSTSQKQLAATTFWAQSPISFSDIDVASSAPLASVDPPAPVTSGNYDVLHGPVGTFHVGKMTSAYAGAVDNGLCGEPDQDDGLLTELRRVFHHRH